MIRHPLFIAALIFALALGITGLLYYCGSQTDDALVWKNIVLTPSQVEGFAPLAEVAWPSDAEIASRKTDTPEAEIAKLIVVESVQRLLWPNMAPNDLKEKMLALRQSVRGNDAIYVRYQAGAQRIQIVGTSAQLRIVVRGPEAKRTGSERDRLEFVRRTMFRIFRDGAQLAQKEMRTRPEGMGLYAEMPTWPPIRSELPKTWDETLRCWTDGINVVFWLTMSPGASSGLMDTRDWFLDYPRKRPNVENRELHPLTVTERDASDRPTPR